MKVCKKVVVMRKNLSIFICFLGFWSILSILRDGGLLVCYFIFEFLLSLLNFINLFYVIIIFNL